MRAVDHVVLGALLHDIGKLLERGGRFDKYRGDNDQQKIDCPWKKGTSGGPSNYHALFSRHFCEWLAEADNRRSLLPDGYNPKDGQADHWINLAARHHKRGRDSTDLQKIVYAADGLASGEREWIITGGFDNLFKTRLESILERVRLPRHLAGKPDSRETSHRLELAPFSPKKEAVFPRHFEAFEPSMEKRTGGRHPGALFSPVSLQEGYRELVSGMEESCGSLAFNPTSPSGFYSFVRDLLALLERFTSAVPSATNIRHPDISLFDHLRISAAIAEGVYHFHYDSDGNPKGPKHFNGRRKSKWRLVCADFSGIQSFIFNITAKGAAKGLRGRSLYISLQSDGMAEHLTRKLGLNPTTIIYSSGGRFYLLIPACKEEALREETAKINRYLLETFQGKVFLGLGIVEVCGDDFRGGNMGEKWQEASENLTADRHKKFMPLIVQDQRTFFTGLALNDRGEKCDCCGRIDEGVTIRKIEARGLCDQCIQLEKLGQKLTDANYLLWVFGGLPGETVKQLESISDKGNVHLFGKPEDGNDFLAVYLLKDRLESYGPIDFGEASFRVEQINPSWDGSEGVLPDVIGFRFIAKWERDKETAFKALLSDKTPEGVQDLDGWDFQKFADHAVGIPRMGILRMDGDNFGELFAVGLREIHGPDGKRTKEMGSLSRVATLSRQLHRFFSGYMQELLQPFNRTQMIYSGGDDLFLIGSWDELPKVAKTIHDDFSTYCANNPSFTISGGLALARGKYPISKSAEMAKDEEKKAKNMANKSALSFLDTPLYWEDFSRADELRGHIELIVDAGSRGIFNRLKAVVMEVDAFKKRQKQATLEKTLSKEEMEKLVFGQRWVWQLVYNLTRFKTRSPEIHERLDRLRDDIIKGQSLPEGRRAIDWLQLPVRWAEFMTRKEK